VLLNYYKITMLIRYLGTRRDPLAFGLPSSTALATIGSQPREQIWVTPTGPDLLDWVPPVQRSRPQVTATTKLCMLRLEGILDAYEPGTLPDRAYRRNPFAQDNDDDGGDCVFELAPHDAPATLKELDDI
jgi:hypothetical protein